MNWEMTSERKENRGFSLFKKKNEIETVNSTARNCMLLISSALSSSSQAKGEKKTHNSFNDIDYCTSLSTHNLNYGNERSR